MTWCIQCGETGRPERAVGVDVDGEPACGLHRVRTDSVFLEKPTAAPSPVQTKAEEVKMVHEKKTCHICGREIADFMFAKHLRTKHQIGGETGSASVTAPARTEQTEASEPTITLELPVSKVQRLLSLLLQ